MSDKTAMIRVLIADDHPLFRAGVAAVVGCQPDMVVVGEAGNGAEAVALSRVHTPDVVLMDVRMPETDGLDALPVIRQTQPDTRVIMVSTYGGDVHMARAFRLGACGYLLKDALRSQLIHTIRASMQQPSGSIAHAVRRAVRAPSPEPLSTREVVVLEKVAHGVSNDDIAQALCISSSAVNARVRRILKKLDARDRTHAVVVAIRRGIIVV